MPNLASPSDLARPLARRGPSPAARERRVIDLLNDDLSIAKSTAREGVGARHAQVRSRPHCPARPRVRRRIHRHAAQPPQRGVADVLRRDVGDESRDGRPGGRDRARTRPPPRLRRRSERNRTVPQATGNPRFGSRNGAGRPVPRQGEWGRAGDGDRRDPGLAVPRRPCSAGARERNRMAPQAIGNARFGSRNGAGPLFPCGGGTGRGGGGGRCDPGLAVPRRPHSAGRGGRNRTAPQAAGNARFQPKWRRSAPQSFPTRLRHLHESNSRCLW